MRESRERVPQTAESEKPWRIGLLVELIDDTLRRHLEISPNMGVIVTKCLEDSPASKAGIEENDIILMADAQPVRSTEELRDAVEKSGDSLRLSTLRKGQSRQVIIRKEMQESPVPRTIPFNRTVVPLIQTAPTHEEEAMMRRMAEQNSRLMERLERQEQEMTRLRGQVEEMVKDMGEMKRDGRKAENEDRTE